MVAELIFYSEAEDLKMKWSSDIRDVLERLVLWYTLDEISLLLGRSKVSVSRKMKVLGVSCLWKKNGARLWTKAEKGALFHYAGSRSQEKVGEELGRSKDSVSWMARRSGIRWKQGSGATLSDVARLAGCSVTYASMKAKRLWPRKKPARGHGIGRRWSLDVEQASLLMKAIRPGRVYLVSSLFE